MKSPTILTFPGTSCSTSDVASELPASSLLVFTVSQKLLVSSIASKDIFGIFTASRDRSRWNWTVGFTCSRNAALFLHSGLEATPKTMAGVGGDVDVDRAPFAIDHLAKYSSNRGSNIVLVGKEELKRV